MFNCVQDTCCSYEMNSIGGLDLFLSYMKLMWKYLQYCSVNVSFQYFLSHDSPESDYCACVHRDCRITTYRMHRENNTTPFIIRMEVQFMELQRTGSTWVKANSKDSLLQVHVILYSPRSRHSLLLSINMNQILAYLFIS
jgi:hypothetical protein